VGFAGRLCSLLGAKRCAGLCSPATLRRAPFAPLGAHRPVRQGAPSGRRDPPAAPRPLARRGDHEREQGQRVANSAKNSIVRVQLPTRTHTHMRAHSHTPTSAQLHTRTGTHTRACTAFLRGTRLPAPDAPPAAPTQRYMRFGPDGLLYVSIGAPCDICPTTTSPEGIEFSSIYTLNVSRGDGGWSLFARGCEGARSFCTRAAGGAGRAGPGPAAPAPRREWRPAALHRRARRARGSRAPARGLTAASIPSPPPSRRRAG
jgi:hypothetical protein